MAETIRMRANVIYNIHQIADEIQRNLLSDFICREPVCNGYAVMLCYEKYFVRVSSFASLTVLISQEMSSTDVVIVGSGGGAGVLNMSWGTNKSYAAEVQKLLLNYGFEVLG